MKKKKIPDIEIQTPHDFVGEVNVSVDRTKSNIAPLTQEFGNGDLNALRDKINELIAQRN